ncbi:lauroyl/myristoyl acyltransferase [Anopheles sinensis]|uniref:Lauroyl/myristoyl acyltransferase n=1 Tax=Anopheles sinensis TaxID=74873 RepID=A0A084WQC9_ANOSI|nr:lauroyl/myristoyl acyltransferase [Anopheles sinensis]
MGCDRAAKLSTGAHVSWTTRPERSALTEGSAEKCATQGTQGGGTRQCWSGSGDTSLDTVDISLGFSAKPDAFSLATISRKWPLRSLRFALDDRTKPAVIERGRKVGLFHYA